MKGVRVSEVYAGAWAGVEDEALAMVAAVVAYQFERGWTDAEIAGRVGCSRVYWNLIRNGRASVGGRVLDRVQAFVRREKAAAAAAVGAAA